MLFPARDLSEAPTAEGIGNGFQIRLGNYNGLCALLSFDEHKNTITYDKDTYNYHFASYGRDAGVDDTYPDYDSFVLDGDGITDEPSQCDLASLPLPTASK